MKRIGIITELIPDKEGVLKRSPGLRSPKISDETRKKIRRSEKVKVKIHEIPVRLAYFNNM